MSQSAREVRQRLIVPITSNHAQNSALELQEYVANIGLNHCLRQLEKDKRRRAREWEVETSNFRRRYNGLIDSACRQRGRRHSPREIAEHRQTCREGRPVQSLRAPEAPRIRARSSEQLRDRSPRPGPLPGEKNGVSPERLHLDIGALANRLESERQCVSARADSRRREDSYLFSVRNSANLDQVRRPLLDPRLASPGSLPTGYPRQSSCRSAEVNRISCQSPPCPEQTSERANEVNPTSCSTSKRVPPRPPSGKLPPLEKSQPPGESEKKLAKERPKRIKRETDDSKEVVVQDTNRDSQEAKEVVSLSPARTESYQKSIEADSSSPAPAEKCQKSASPAATEGSQKSKEAVFLSPASAEKARPRRRTPRKISRTTTHVVYQSEEEKKTTWSYNWPSSTWQQVVQAMANVAVIPQIVISTSDETGDKASPRKGSRRGSLTGAAEAPEGSARGASMGGLAAPAVSRSRSRSLPNVMDPGLVLRMASQGKDDDTEDEGEEDGHLQVDLLGPARKRSNSWCPGKAPNLPRRRGSRSEHLDSPRPSVKHETDGGARRRRMSLSMERLLRDLSLGIEHKEFASIPEYNPADEGLWKDLKKCRYLRKPVKKYQTSEDPDAVEPTLSKT